MSQGILITVVALGGAIGAILRFIIVSLTAATFGSYLPFGTLVVNVIGSFIAGLVIVFLLEKNILPPYLSHLILIGFLGSLTTFSTFSVETLQFFQNTEYLKAMMNIMLNVMLSLLAAYLGMMVVRS